MPSADRVPQVPVALSVGAATYVTADQYNFLVGLLSGDEPAATGGGSSVPRFAAPVRLVTFDGVDNDGAALTDALTGRPAPSLLVRGKHGRHFEVEHSGGGAILLVHDAGISLGGDVSLDGDLDATGDVSLAGAFDMVGDMTIDGTLDVTGGVSFGTLVVEDLTVTDDLTVNDDARVMGDMTIDGHATIGGNNGIGGSLAVGVSLDVGSDLVVHQDFQVVRDSTLHKTTVIGPGAGNDQALFLYHNAGSGPFTLGATNAADPVLVFKDASGDQTFEVGNSSSAYQARVYGKLDVDSDVNVDGGITVDLAMTIGTDLIVGDEVTVSGVAHLNGDVEIAGELEVNDIAVFNEAVAFNDPTTFVDSVLVTGTTIDLTTAYIDFDPALTSGVGFTKSLWSGSIQVKINGTTVHVPYSTAAT